MAATALAPSAPKRRPIGSSYVEEVLLSDDEDMVVTSTVVASAHKPNTSTPLVQDFRPKTEAFEPPISASIMPRLRDLGQTSDKWRSSAKASSAGIPYESKQAQLPESKIDFDDGNLSAPSRSVSAWAHLSRSSSRYSDNNEDYDGYEGSSSDFNGPGLGKEALQNINRINRVASAHSSSRTDKIEDTHSQPTSVVSAAAPATRSVEFTQDGGKVVRYRNGTVKEIKADGSMEVRFTNGAE